MMGGTTDANALTLSLQGSTARDADWSWICSQFYHTTSSKRDTALAFDRIVSTREMRETLVEHHNRQPADPGIQASVAAWSPAQSPSFVKALLGSHPNDALETSDKMAKFWHALQTCGHVVIDPPPPKLSPLINDNDPGTFWTVPRRAPAMWRPTMPFYGAWRTTLIRTWNNTHHCRWSNPQNSSCQTSTLQLTLCYRQPLNHHTPYHNTCNSQNTVLGTFTWCVSKLSCRGSL
jgi:hypothetical protein